MPKHFNRLAKEYGHYRHVAKHLPPGSKDNEPLDQFISRLRREWARQDQIRQARRASRNWRDPLPVVSGRILYLRDAKLRDAANLLQSKIAEKIRAEQQAHCEWCRRAKRRAAAALRKMGFRLERRASRDSASSYYSRFTPDHRLITARISDHEVPITDERRWNQENGGRTWADSAMSLVLDADADDAAVDSWLEHVRGVVQYERQL